MTYPEPHAGEISHRTWTLLVSLATLCVGLLLGHFWARTNHLDRIAERGDLIEVTILEQKHSKTDGSWWLLKTNDGQRGYIKYYRGKPGDTFLMSPSELRGYLPPPTLVPADHQMHIQLDASPARKRRVDEDLR